MEKFLVSGHAIAGDSNGFALILTHKDCDRSFIWGYSGGAPALDQVNGWASAHSCGQDGWRRISAEDLAAI